MTARLSSVASRRRAASLGLELEPLGVSTAPVAFDGTFFTQRTVTSTDLAITLRPVTTSAAEGTLELALQHTFSHALLGRGLAVRRSQIEVWWSDQRTQR
jgi:hypothetical protein